jgi:hypothetical protein
LLLLPHPVDHQNTHNWNFISYWPLWGGGRGVPCSSEKGAVRLRTTHIQIGLCIIDYQTGIRMILGWCVDSPEEKREGQDNCPAFWPQSTDMQLLPTAFLTPSPPGGTQTSKKSFTSHTVNGCHWQMFARFTVHCNEVFCLAEVLNCTYQEHSLRKKSIHKCHCMCCCHGAHLQKPHQL